jgi:nucleoside triphosphate diphosphatase
LSLAEALLDLQRLTEQLRTDCPWDREQTAETIVPHTVEEAYEVADAARAGDPSKLADELGDLLYQVFFLSLLLQEEDRGSLETVARRVHDKLVRRHPHVFGNAAPPTTAGEVKHRWEDLKREHEQREGIFHDVPASLPALLFARKVQRRAAAVGFEYPDVAGALADLEDELAELRAELAGTLDAAPELPPDRRQADEVGDILFAAVNVARRLNADPELELRAAAARFVDRVDEAARRAAADGSDFGTLTLAEQDRYFDLAKDAE